MENLPKLCNFYIKFTKISSFEKYYKNGLFIFLGHNFTILESTSNKTTLTEAIE